MRNRFKFAFLLYCGAFWFPCYLGWFILPAYCLLIDACVLSQASFWAGVWWGSFATGASLWGLLYGLLGFAQGPLGYKLLVILLIIIVYGFLGGIWFWISNRVAAYGPTCAWKKSVWISTSGVWSLLVQPFVPIGVTSSYVSPVVGNPIGVIFDYQLNGITLAYDIAAVCKQGCITKREAVFFLPESAVKRPLLGDSALPIILAQELGFDAQIIIGGFREQNGLWYNTLFWFSEGKLQDSFDKHFLVPFAECSLGRFAPDWLHRLFFSQSHEITAGCLQRPVWDIPHVGTAVPYICSELFFSYLPTGPSDAIILAVCNDAWAPLYIRELMRIAASFKAWLWRRKLIYIAFVS